MSGYSFETTLGTDPDGYDDEDRITYFKRSNTTNPQTWTLTTVGDWSSWKNFSTTAETRTHGAADELTRMGSGTTPATILYDTKGNITQNQRTPGNSSTYQNYVWDFDKTSSKAMSVIILRSACDNAKTKLSCILERAFFDGNGLPAKYMILVPAFKIWFFSKRRDSPIGLSFL
jgi:hypothetical protein